MNPCSTNRKPIALLVVDALNASEARELRAHIQTCEGCRAYLQEISDVTQKLGAFEVRSEIQTSEAFHQRVVRSLRAEETASPLSSLLTQLRVAMSNWRVALPVAGATALLVAAFVFFMRPSPVTNIVNVSPPNVKTERDPTISNYQMIANRSLEKFDELLNRQATRNSSAGPIYTASMLSAHDGLD